MRGGDRGRGGTGEYVRARRVKSQHSDFGQDSRRSQAPRTGLRGFRRSGVCAGARDRSPRAGWSDGRGLAAGRTWAGRASRAKTSRNSREWRLLVSPPFSESARLILKVSHNLHASTLPLLLAARQGKRTLDEGLHVQHDVLGRLGVDVDTISFGGGAGGSVADLVTPRATLQLLRHMSTRGDAQAYKDAMPILGVDGTLADAVGHDSPARGKVFAKTGTYFWDNTMNNRILLTSKALAGTMTTATNRHLAIALFVNNVHLEKAADTARVGKTLGKLCEVIYKCE